MHPLRNGSQVTARPARKTTAGTAGYFSESNDNSQPSYPGQDWFNDVIDEFLNALGSMGLEYNPENLNHLAQLLTGDVIKWTSFPIGVPFPVRNYGPSYSFLPPNSNDLFRFVTLTADDPYNSNILIDKVITGSSPNLIVEMNVNAPGKARHGETIRMLNTMGASIRPSLNFSEILNDAIRNITADMTGFVGDSGVVVPQSPAGAFYQFGTGISAVLSGTTGTSNNYGFGFDASRVVPTANENRIFTEGWTFIERIW
ncbi:hypothetical protein RX455_004425 [Vibrio fluvialis]|nr:hypothetical protein [Vibrio fluvialis]